MFLADENENEMQQLITTQIGFANGYFRSTEADLDYNCPGLLESMELQVHTLDEDHARAVTRRTNQQDALAMRHRSCCSRRDQERARVRSPRERRKGNTAISAESRPLQGIRNGRPATECNSGHVPVHLQNPGRIGRVALLLERDSAGR